MRTVREGVALASYATSAILWCIRTSGISSSSARDAGEHDCDCSEQNRFVEVLHAALRVDEKISVYVESSIFRHENGSMAIQLRNCNPPHPTAPRSPQGASLSRTLRRACRVVRHAIGSSIFSLFAEKAMSVGPAPKFLHSSSDLPGSLSGKQSSQVSRDASRFDKLAGSTEFTCQLNRCMKRGFLIRR